jgi:hypothetical protein
MAGASVARRADVLRRVTDLFMSGTGSFSQAQIELFDDVMMRLAEGLEVAARAAFGSRLATTTDAPLKVIRLLAFDGAIEVAGPVLSQSPRVSDDLLVENASTMSQDHLLAISKRTQINDSVTDVLLARGNAAVISSTVANDGSSFSKSGFSQRPCQVKGRRRSRNAHSAAAAGGVASAKALAMASSTCSSQMNESLSRAVFGISSKSRRFRAGNITLVKPAPAAATTFSLMPPTGRIRPRSEISPVMAVSCRTVRLVRSEASAVNMATPALGPSFGVAPAGT